MALTEIARKLKETYGGFDVSGFQDELDRFRNLYGAAESIRIGEMDYIVIDDVYKNEECEDVPESTSPLFFNSINNNYAIIDAETSSTLIDEVYSLITYMQRDCESGARIPFPDEIKNALRNIIGNGESVITARITEDDDSEGGLSKNKANIFQCHLIKDTGVSAAPDVYSFMLKDGKIKEVADSAIKLIKDSGTLSMLDDSNIEELKLTEPAIQEAVFNKYINADIDIQSVTVKSIFEIKMAYCNIQLLMQSQRGKHKLNSVFNTSYLASENNEFEALNANIHVCGCCKRDLVDVRDEHKIHRLHANLDVYDEKQTVDALGARKQKITKADLLDNIFYSTGCESCLVQCDKCGGWHFNYQELVGSNIYDKLTLTPGRAFIKGIREFNVNYCSCREGIEWVYDEFSGSEDEHDVIPIEELGFFNYANEKLKDFKDYSAYLEKELKRASNRDAMAEMEAARSALEKYKNILAHEFNIEVSSIKISSAAKCHECCVCGGEYYGRLKNGRCSICSEMFEENRHMVTRVDGVIFMISGNKNSRTISRYVLTKLGNLKLIGTPKTVSTAPQADDATDVGEPVSDAAVSAPQASAEAQKADNDSAPKTANKPVGKKSEAKSGNNSKKKHARR